METAKVTRSVGKWSNGRGIESGNRSKLRSRAGKARGLESRECARQDIYSGVRSVLTANGSNRTRGSGKAQSVSNKLYRLYN